MQNKRLQNSIGRINYNNYELRFIKNGELDSIFLNRLEFELLVDNIEGQKSLIRNRCGGVLEDLVAVFRNDEGFTFTIYFNSKQVKVYNFKKPINEFMFITELNYKKVYAELLQV